MKTHFNQVILLAGVIGFGATVGRGQTLKANIPFQFQTSNAVMPPGEYSVSQSQPGSPVIVLRNQEVHKTDMIMAKTRIASSSNTPARLVFRCSNDRCALAEIWGATSGGGVQLWQPRGKGREPERLAVVYFKPNPRQ